MKDIKTVGEYVATVVYHKEVKVEVPVTVLAENDGAAEKPAVEVKAEAEGAAAEEALDSQASAVEAVVEENEAEAPAAE